MAFTLGAGAVERIAALEVQQELDDELTAKARAEVQAAELEKYRRSSWLWAKTDEAMAKGKDTFVSFLSQTGP